MRTNSEHMGCLTSGVQLFHFDCDGGRLVKKARPVAKAELV